MHDGDRSRFQYEPVRVLGDIDIAGPVGVVIVLYLPDQRATDVRAHDSSRNRQRDAAHFRQCIRDRFLDRRNVQFG